VARSWDSWARKPYFVYDEEHVRLTRQNHAAIAEALLCCTREELVKIMRDQSEPNLVWILARTIYQAGKQGAYKLIQPILDHVIGKPTENIVILPPPGQTSERAKNFDEFCERAGYPLPYVKQVEMRKFGHCEDGARLLLGARGYGKTDYVTILGTAYELFRSFFSISGAEADMSYLLVTKSDERNAAIITEITKAAEANGVTFEKKAGTAIRVDGLKGKDHSVSGITIGSASIRGRHPKRVIMDDPVTEEDVSEATRRRAKAVYNELSKLTPNILIIGQPVHKFDLYEELRPLLKKIEVPHGAIPELDHDLTAQKLAGVSEESISASYHLKVISEAGNPLENVGFVETFPPGGCVAFVDPSFEGGDYTAISVVKMLGQGVLVFGKVWKRAWFNCVDDIQAVVSSKGVQRLCFETNCLGEQPVVILRDVLEGCGVVGRKTTGHKHSRIVAAGAFAPMIHVARDSDRLYIDQVTKYEYGVKNDDAPDSLASCLEWIGLIRGQKALGRAV
jgi:hypothetical protein